MSEQHENIEHRVREALLAEGSEAPTPTDLWARVQPRLERPATPSVGWQRRWSLVAAGAAAAVLLAMGGAGTALIATGLSSGSEDEAILAFSGADGAWSGADGDSFGVTIYNETRSRLDDPEGNRLARGDSVIAAFSVDPGLTEVLGPRGEPLPERPPALEMRSPILVTSNPSSGNPQGVAGERQVISQASLDLEVGDVNAAAIQLRGLVESFGGFIEHVSTSGGPNPEHGSAVVRVSGDRFLDALDNIGRLGKTVGQTLGQRDVMGEAIDFEARLRSERSTEQSLLKLLDRAVSVSDVLTVERELTRVRADIERLQGQLEFIQRSVALATIAVSFVLPPGSIPAAPSASLQVEVGDVGRAVSRIQELVSGAGGTMGQVISTTRRHSQEAFLSFLIPASALDGALTSLAGEGVVLRREVQSDGRLRQDERDDGLQAKVTVQLQNPDDSYPWRSIGALAAGAALLLLSASGALALVFRARRRRA